MTPAGGPLSLSHDGGRHWDDPVLVQADGVDRSGKLTATNYFNDADRTSGRV